MQRSASGGDLLHRSDAAHRRSARCAVAVLLQVRLEFTHPHLFRQHFAEKRFRYGFSIYGVFSW